MPLGTIRLMETYSIEGAIDEDNARRLRHHILSLLRSAMPSPPNLSRAIAVACGGNAEALVRLAPGPARRRSSDDQRAPAAGSDLAAACARRAGTNARFPRAARPRGSDGHRGDHHHHAWRSGSGLRSMLVPGVGVREGILLDLVAEQYSAAIASEEERGRAEEMLAGARWFARPPGLRRAARRAGGAPRAFAIRPIAPAARDGTGPAAHAGNGRAAARRGTFRESQSRTTVTANI